MNNYGVTVFLLAMYVFFLVLSIIDEHDDEQ